MGQALQTRNGMVWRWRWLIVPLQFSTLSQPFGRQRKAEHPYRPHSSICSALTIDPHLSEQILDMPLMKRTHLSPCLQVRYFIIVHPRLYMSFALMDRCWA
ncbi:hypothetical protein B0O80DRAFT_168085 [Mortierella sp. GBAus27b]|nr:hypothetical protein B0O80DRAFT_168085 [Mortierella sp. GBAus27b]